MTTAWAVIVTAIIVALTAAAIGIRAAYRREARERREARDKLHDAWITNRELEKARQRYELNAAYVRGVEDGRTSDTLYRQFLKQAQDGRAVCAIQKERR